MPRKRKTTAEIEYMKVLGKRIKTARLRKGSLTGYQPMTQAELGEATGLNKITISRYENGLLSIGLYPLKEIAAALKVDIRWLLYGKK